MKFLYFAFLVLFTSSVEAQQKVVIHTYDVLPPYAFVEKGRLTGIYIEIVRLANSRMPDYNIEFEVVPWERAKRLAKSGSTFAILPPYFHAHDWLTDKGEPYLWPYSLELSRQYDVVTCHSNVDLKPLKRFPEDFSNLRFVMFRGDGRAGDKFDSLVKQGKIKLDQVDDHEDIILKLLSGRNDCTVTSRLPLRWTLRKMSDRGELDSFKTGLPLLEAYQLRAQAAYLGYSNIASEKDYPYKKDFAIKFDIEIFKMRRSGEIEAITRRFVDPLVTSTKTQSH